MGVGDEWIRWLGVVVVVGLVVGVVMVVTWSWAVFWVGEIREHGGGCGEGLRGDRCCF